MMSLYSSLWGEEVADGRDIEIKRSLTNVTDLFWVRGQHPVVGYCLFPSLGSRAVPGSPECSHQVIPVDTLCEESRSPP